ncbi:hypothetical protein [Candidatus Vampirococcus lugosii]|uniref:Uncharacterized protein n=1 Tax=Candidatus Vampirococcus lugosii TaxID=2789015 RepID=A0ABS5QMB2_9BACT|nr:hypothetical protein [Candidatus Vampirococcus lugosii]MBS8122350.1 hypothetical protein [Candidatus Vampirococcus lugosii]
MKKYILMFIKFISLLFVILSLVLLVGTYVNEKYYIELGKVYLGNELKKQVVEKTDDFYGNIKNDNQIVGGILEKVGVDKLVNIGKEKITDNIDTILDKAIKGGIFLGKYEFSDDTLFGLGKIGNEIKSKITNYVKDIKDNFFRDIRIFLITNLIGFGFIYFILSYKNKIYVAKNMFYSVLIFFLVLLGGSLFYVLGQDWLMNLVSNTYLGYYYPLLILTFTGFFIHWFYNEFFI